MKIEREREVEKGRGREGEREEREEREDGKKIDRQSERYIFETDKTGKEWEKGCVKLHIVGIKRKLKWSQQDNVRSMREMLLHIRKGSWKGRS